VTNPIAGKQVHQRNKSTPALSTLMANGAQKVGAKRTAFADVSNTARTQPAQDDSTINGKGAKVVVSDFQKPTVVVKPAQKPLAAKTTTLTTTSNIPIKPAASSIPAPQGQTAVVRKVAPKRSAPVLRDAYQGVQLPQVPEVGVEQITVQDHVTAPIVVELDIIGEESCATSGPVQPVTASDMSSSVEDHYILALEQQAQTMETHRNAAVAREAEVTVYEAEYEEDDELDFELDETTRNITGGATATTIVLAPRVTKKVQKELAEARILVESSRTPEDVEEEQWDTSMVAEYGEEIFEYMRSLEVSLYCCP